MRPFPSILLTIIGLSALFAWPDIEATCHEDSITFFGQAFDQKFISTSESGSLSRHCDKNGKFAILMHGFLQTCEEPYMVELIERLAIARGGCILCMDYRNYSRTIRFSKLVDNFDGISRVLINKLNQFESEGFLPINGYMFGFSFGAHLAIKSAFDAFGSNKFGLIDACDPAGPMFDGTWRELKDAHQAAINVQCIHTSSNLGTKSRRCDQNWLMGYCGVYQPASPRVKKSHSMCPIFYNLAFEKEFPAVQKPWVCGKIRKTHNVESWPAGYKMGYDESRLDQSGQVFGTLFANTYAKYPYNQCDA